MRTAALALVLSMMLVATGARAGDLPDLPGQPTWVFFRDKGLASASDEAAAIAAARAALTPRAIARRAKVRAKTVDLLDVPVHEPYVQSVLATGAAARHRLKWLNAVTVDATASQIRAIESLPFVASTRPVATQVREEPVREVRPAATGRAPAGRSVLNYGDCASQIVPIQVDQLHDVGITGAGVLIAVFDTGFDVSVHEALQSVDVVAEWDFVQGDDNTSNEGDDPANQFYHGTQVLSTIAGFSPGNLIGPAYGASYLLGKTETLLSETPAEEDNWAAAAEWADSLGADLITSSLSYKDWYTYEDMDGETAVITIAADLAVANGIAVFNSAGNEGSGSWFHITAPGDGNEVLTVGAVDSLNIIADFSSRGPTFDGRIKPDVCAMGVAVQYAEPWDPSGTGYSRGNGTSFSCPITAGVGALLLAASPSLTPATLAEALRETATRSGAPDNDYGWGLVQAADAWQRIATFSPEVPAAAGPHLAVSPNPSSSAQTIRWARNAGAPAASDRLEIVDVSGRLVRTLAVGSAAESVRWDGRDEVGRPVATGVYFGRLASAPAGAVARIVRLR